MNSKEMDNKSKLLLSENEIKVIENRRVMREAYAENDYVYVWDNGQLPDIGYLNRALTKTLKANGLRHIRLHDLRHSTASYLNKLGFSPKEIQIWLGHSDISTTMNIYTHIDIGMKVGMAEKINTLFGDKISWAPIFRRFLEKRQKKKSSKIVKNLETLATTGPSDRLLYSAVITSRLLETVQGGRAHKLCGLLNPMGE